MSTSFWRRTKLFDIVSKISIKGFNINTHWILTIFKSFSNIINKHIRYLFIKVTKIIKVSR